MAGDAQCAGTRSSGGAGRPAGGPWFASADAVLTEFGAGFVRTQVHPGPTARRITYRFTKDGRSVLLTTFRKQRDKERAEIERARTQVVADAASKTSASRR